MKRIGRIPIALLVVGLVGCGSDEGRFQGVWEPQEVKRDELEADAAWRPYNEIEFFKDTLIIRSNNDTVRATFSTDRSTNPPQIDLKWGKGDTVKGIYEFKDDETVVICIAKEGSDRPEKFESKNVNTLYMKLTRKKMKK